MTKSNAGFTMIEVLIATSVVTLTLIAISSGVSFAVKNANFSQEKSQSIRYAQQSIEWLRSMRDSLGWNGFYAILQADGGTQFVYCLETIPSSVAEFEALSGEPDALNCGQIGSTNFVRSLDINLTDSQTVELRSLVVWSDGSETNQTELTTSLKQWR